MMHEELKQRSYEANLLLPKYGLIHLTFGNASVIDRDKGVIAIKPSGVDYEALAFEDMVLVDLDGKKVDGRYNPSSDTPSHVQLYHAFDTINAVVHTHSKFATAFAQAGMAIPCYGTTHADFFYGDIPLTRKLTREEIKCDYERHTGCVIAERFEDKDPGEYPGVLAHSHGPFAWGASGQIAAENAFAMELLAEIAFYTKQLNPNTEPIDQDLLNKHYKRKHGKNAYYGQT